MKLWILAGASTGILVAWLVTSLVLPDDPAAEPAPAPDAPAHSFERELAESRTEAESLSLELERLAAAPRPKPPAVSPAPRPAPAWKALARRVVASFAEDADPQLQASNMDELFRLAQTTVEEHGGTLDEAGVCPWVGPALLLAFLDTFDPPPDAAQRERFEEAMVAARKAWTAYGARREGLEGFDRTRALLDLDAAGLGALYPLLTPGQMDRLSKIPFVSSCGVTASYHASRTGKAAEVEGHIVADCRRRLGLDESQDTALLTATREYVRNCSDLPARSPTGRPSRERLRAEVDLMVRLLGDIEGSVRLTDEQRQVLKSWTQVYDVRIR